ncbi:MAG: hypothetical protein B6I18_01835 [Bacteroidetes bacterium 4572_112]|nr:MAG: hypothetical protein B6I18_01835 [Bacteroidetes bacterium 4572_112]
MKNLLLLIFILLITNLFAQEEEEATGPWTKGGTIGLNGSQTSFYNWAKGGENQISLSGNIKAFINHKNDNTSWENLLLMDLGSSRQGKQDWRKGDDRFEYNTIYGIKASEQWYYSALFNFKTQFTSGYEFDDAGNSTYISNFMAPAYIKLGLGMDYKPNKNFSAFLSPLTAKWTIVKDQALADAGKFGLDAAETKTYTATDGSDSIVIINSASKLRTEAGALVRFTYSKDVMKNVNFATILEFYSNYLQNPQNIDVDWEFIATFKINDFLNAQIKGHLIYDDDVMIDVDSNNDGVIDMHGPRTQFNEALTIGIVYTL